MFAPFTASARSYLVQRLVHPAVMATDGGVEDIVGVLKGIHEGHRVRADGLQQVACSAVDHRNLGGAQCHKNDMCSPKEEPRTSAKTVASTESSTLCNKLASQQDDGTSAQAGGGGGEGGGAIPGQQ